MSDNHIVESGSVQSQVVGFPESCGQPKGDGRRKVQLRASMERSDAYKRLPSGAWRVLTAMWELADSPRGSEPWVHGRCKVRTLADRTGLSESQVHRWLRRLRVPEDGKVAPADSLGGWIDTRVCAGRFLAWTVYASPGSVVEARPVAPTQGHFTRRRESSSHDDARSPHTSTHEEVTHPRVSDIPPQSSTTKDHSSSTTTTNHAQARADDSSGASVDGGGGGDFDAIAGELRTFGVWSARIVELAQRVALTPDGLRRLRATTTRAKREARSPVPMVVRAIERDELDPAPPTFNVPDSPRRPTRGMTRDEFKAWGTSWAMLFRAMTDELRDANVNPSETVNGAKGVAYAEDGRTWVPLWSQPEAHRQAEVVEVFNELNRRIVEAGRQPFAPPTDEDFGSAGAAGGTASESVAAFA